MIAPLLAMAFASLDTTTAGEGIVSLRQVSIRLTPADDATTSAAKAKTLRDAAAGITSCDQVPAVAARIGAEVVSSDAVPLSSLPAPLRERVAALAVGTATPVFGSRGEAVRVLVLCGRK